MPSFHSASASSKQNSPSKYLGLSFFRDKSNYFSLEMRCRSQAIDAIVSQCQSLFPVTGRENTVYITSKGIFVINPQWGKIMTLAKKLTCDLASYRYRNIFGNYSFKVFRKDFGEDSLQNSHLQSPMKPKSLDQFR